MPRKDRDLYAEKVKGAIPENADEAYLLDRAMKEKERELLAEAIAEALAEKKQRVGAPRKTGGDVQLAQELLGQHDGNVKLARQAFVRAVGNQDDIGAKRARERFRKALEDLKTQSGFSAV
jgi:hypothetical protein